jgi:hypothetical protein
MPDPNGNFYLGDSTGTLGPNYLDPTPMGSRRLGWVAASP